MSELHMRHYGQGTSLDPLLLAQWAAWEADALLSSGYYEDKAPAPVVVVGTGRSGLTRATALALALSAHPAAPLVGLCPVSSPGATPHTAQLGLWPFQASAASKVFVVYADDLVSQGDTLRHCRKALVEELPEGVEVLATFVALSQDGPTLAHWPGHPTFVPKKAKESFRAFVYGAEIRRGPYTAQDGRRW